MTDPGAVIPADRDPGLDKGSGVAGQAGPATRTRGHSCPVRTVSDLCWIFLCLISHLFTIIDNVMIILLQNSGSELIRI